MNLKFLNRIELDQRIRSLATKEKELLHDILQTIRYRSKVCGIFIFPKLLPEKSV